MKKNKVDLSAVLEIMVWKIEIASATPRNDEESGSLHPPAWAEALRRDDKQTALRVTGWALEIMAWVSQWLGYFFKSRLSIISPLVL